MEGSAVLPLGGQDLAKSLKKVGERSGVIKMPHAL
jgi:hypothetical protein